MLAPRPPRRRAGGGGRATRAAVAKSSMQACRLVVEQNGTRARTSGRRREARSPVCQRHAHLCVRRAERGGGGARCRSGLALQRAEDRSVLQISTLFSKKTIDSESEVITAALLTAEGVKEEEEPAAEAAPLCCAWRMNQSCCLTFVLKKTTSNESEVMTCDVAIRLAHFPWLVAR